MTKGWRYLQFSSLNNCHAVIGQRCFISFDSDHFMIFVKIRLILQKLGRLWLEHLTVRDL
jgi:hypothetical protein